MRRALGFSMTVCAVVTSLSAEALAERAPRIETSVSPACEDAARNLEGRLRRALAARNAPELEISVSIRDDDGGYRMTLVTRDGSPERGEKVILAATCDEAVDAAVVVLGFGTSEAFDEASIPGASTTPGMAPAPAISPAPAPPLVRNGATAAPKDEGAKRVESSSGSTSSRASLSTGLDAGTLPSPTLVVSGGMGRSFSAFEVRGVARYGLPIVEETTETGFSESVRRDFGALELLACYGIGGDVRLLACSGGELGVLRVTHRMEGGGTDVDEDEVVPRLAGVFSALVRHQGGAVQPELEVSGSAVAVGRQESASLVALRVSAGATVEF